MQCKTCGLWAQTRHVAFYQNIGVVYLRFTKSIQGELCGACIHKHFWEFTTVNLIAGWWGIISFCVTPFFILNNLFYYAAFLVGKSRRRRDPDEEKDPLSSANEKGLCYLCGKPLEPEQLQTRVCKACRESPKGTL
jgi:hypothetical protein